MEDNFIHRSQSHVYYFEPQQCRASRYEQRPRFFEFGVWVTLAVSMRGIPSPISTWPKQVDRSVLNLPPRIVTTASHTSADAGHVHI